ncbi:hypothetical protein PN478_10755 [Dolichospermum circinale CS-534/05]|uniref:hypothetical protein n=1 Tax=Dolichospermum circinale TaxID=109265 RepID=UPI0023308F52|nr:hypothetical protein [Dolichospermum circinale]MDB9455705.1 hypothetical protein [Dolichospermum circinale CS-541/06]MDB9461850.1 hypothetical protein [Dolichospermum circinale CS-541/04]MDB9490999.1 hypothetical protein [Dolichospermum circinale CS-534/05]MDB9547435.1 hypothetical protein [Dolichospermum circinale CS-1031]
MSVNTIESELLVELSKQEQQLLSGGKKGVLEGTGDFVYGGRTFPATFTVTVRNLPDIEKREETP